MALSDLNPVSYHIAGAAFVVLASILTRRLFFHKLRDFPGPKLAACTTLYKTYYEVFKGGELLQHILELHSLYGPVVRIAPNELHFNELQLTKISIPTFYKCFGADGSTFGTVDPLDSKRRRNALSAMFSRRAISKFEGIIQEKIDKLITRLAEHRHRKPVNMFFAFRCATMDIITSYCFATCVDSLDASDFRDPLLIAIQSAAPLIWVMKLIPVLIPTISSLPVTLAKRLNTELMAFLNLRRMISTQIDIILKDKELLENTTTPTIYHRLLNPSIEKDGHTSPSRQDLFEEALSLLQAGSDTVGNTCTLGTFYILNNPEIKLRLSKELRDFWPNPQEPIGHSSLQKLPYLTAVIKESLRVSHGFVTPLPRVVRAINAEIAGYQIPEGTVVSASVTCLHNNVRIFPDPQVFSPERWLQSNFRTLDRHLVPFSRGPRMCLGINLAWCELYLIFANVFRKLDLEVHNTSIEDFNRFKDFFIPIHQGRQLHALVR